MKYVRLNHLCGVFKLEKGSERGIEGHNCVLDLCLPVLESYTLQFTFVNMRRKEVDAMNDFFLVDMEDVQRDRMFGRKEDEAVKGS